MDYAGFNYSLEGIAARIKNSNLEVPVYQRSYAWGDSQVQDYWSDLFSSFKMGSNNYFMGTLVIKSEAGVDRDTIIDGQQRLATTMILLAAVRNAFREKSDDKRAESIQSDYISTTDLGSASEIPRLLMNSEDKLFFQKYIVENQRDVAPEQRSHHLIAGAMTFFRKELEKLVIESGSQWTVELANLVQYLKSSLVVMVLTVSSDSDAFLIFETLNDRGADLTLADLLKNYLFGRAQDHLESVKHNWIQALGALESSNEDAILTKYLRHHWSSSHGLVREKALYSDIKRSVRTSMQALEYSNDLRKSSDLYAAVLNSHHPYWDEYDTATRNNVETLQRFRIEQNRPLLLAILGKFEKSETKNALRAMVSWAVRGLVVGGIGGGAYETAYCDAAKLVNDGLITNTTELLDKLSSIVPSDTAFERSFSLAEVQKGYLARYYLRSMERFLLNEKEPELVPNEDVDSVNLEHVLPKRPSDKGWGKHFTSDELLGYTYRLGNQALMQKTPNSRIGNKSFEDKKVVYGKSKFRMTRELAEMESWTKKAIDDRQLSMAKMAVEIWKR